MSADGCQTLINIQVKPRASRAHIEGFSGDVLVVTLTAPPVRGEANRQLITLVAKALGIGHSAVSLVRGEKCRNKVIRIEGMSAVQVHDTLT